MKSKIKVGGLKPRFNIFYTSIWFFPIICTLVLLLLTAFKINGSSIGIYNEIFYEPGHKDSSLIVNKPRPIRSDEWLWNSQMIMAQSNNNFSRINNNLGSGQDMSLIIDVPYKDWSAIFRPQNLVFFILPFQYAFAFKWWLMAYLLVLACYFFALYMLPKKRLLSSSIALALLFSPFIQWWYQYITLAPLYYSFFILLAFMYFLKTDNNRRKVLLSLSIAYLLVCFALVLYPPFQIACALAAFAFALGYFIKYSKDKRTKTIFKNLALLAASGLLAGIMVLAFIHTRSSSVHKIENTAYPGKRIIDSGGSDLPNLLSGQLDFQLQFSSKAAKYVLPKQGLGNQSEDSNFLLLMPFLFLPSLYILYRDRRQKLTIDWLLVSLNICFLGFMAWLFIPHLESIGKAFLLTEVPQNRLLIGFGLLNTLLIVVFANRLQSLKKNPFTTRFVAIYASLIFVCELLLALHIKDASPGYIGLHRALAFSLPIPIVVYLFLTRRITASVLAILAFSFFMTIGVHPLYRGTNIITNDPSSKAIRAISAKNSNAWAVEDNYLENFPLLNGAHSLSGVYTIPQLQIWSQVKGVFPDTYNRYAHTNFAFDRNPNVQIPTSINLVGNDHFVITTEPCSQFLRNNKVSFLLTSAPLMLNDNCLRLADKVIYPAKVIYIYKII